MLNYSVIPGKGPTFTRQRRASSRAVKALTSMLVSPQVLPFGIMGEPLRQYHGSLFVDNNVKMRLKLELTRTVG